MVREPYYLKERTRIAKENLASLIAVAIVLSAAIGLATNLLASFVADRYNLKLWLLACLITIMLLTIAVVYHIYAHGYDTQILIDVLLPFRVTQTEAEIVEATPYPVSQIAHRELAKLLRGGEQKQKFIADWRKADNQDQPLIHGYVRECVQDLLEYVVLFTLKRYGRMTLTPNVVYTNRGWISSGFTGKQVALEQWPEKLRQNILFQDSSKPAFKILNIPEETNLGVDQRRWKVKSQTREITLDSRYGKVSFSFSPYVPKISERSREGQILRKYCGAADQTELWMAKFYLRIAADFHGWRIFTSSFQKSFLPWVEGLFEYFEDSLDWNRCAHRDLERMLVDLNERIKACEHSLHSPDREQGERVKEVVGDEG